MRAPVLRSERLPFGDRLHIERFRFDNGLELLVLPDSSAKIISYNTWFRVGSRDEVTNKTGIAHLLEHMMFIATKNMAEGEFDKLIEHAGGESNAATWTDWTYYHENLPSSELPLAIKVEADRMQNLVLGKARVASEIEVVTSERRNVVDDDVEGRVAEVLYANAFGKTHPYGWPTIGWKSDIEGYEAKDCASFYKTHYAPNRATIVIAGDVDPADVAKRIQKAYGAIPASKKVRAEMQPTKPRPASEKTLRLPTPTEKIAMAWHAPRYADRDHAVALIISQLLTGGRSARLFRELIHVKELATEVRAGAVPFEHASLFDVSASAREGVAIQKSREVIEKALKKLSTTLVEKDELEKVKNRYELGFLSSLETVSGKAEQIGFSALVAHDPTHSFKRLEEVRSVTPEDVRRVSRAIFSGPCTTVLVVPSKSGKAARS